MSTYRFDDGFVVRVAGDEEGGDPPVTPPVADELPDDFKNVSLTPEQQKLVNSVLKKEKEKHKSAAEKAIAQLQQLQKNQNLSEQERNDLSKQVQEYKKVVMTKDQLAAEERLALKKQYDDEKNNIATERDEWKNRFTSSTIERELVAAAVKYEAFDPDQIIAMLERKAEIVPDPDNPKRLVTKIKMDDEVDGKMVTLSLTPSEAVERMTKKEKHANLFKTTAKGGIGGNTTPTSIGALTPEKLAEIASNPELYEKHRAQIMAMQF